MILILLKRMNVPLDRDVIFLAEAGEEGTATYGIDYMVKEHWPEIDSEYALAEGGALIDENGKPRYALVGTTEKNRSACVSSRTAPPDTPRARAWITPSYTSPRPSRGGNWQTPVRFNDTTRTYFAGLAPLVAPERRALSGAAGPQAHRRDRSLLPPVRSRALLHLRTSVVPTLITAGFRSNVIPSEAEATLDVRAFPDEDMPKFIAELKRIINDPSIEVIPPTANSRPFGPPSRLDTEMYRAFEKVGRRLFNVPTLPYLLTAATDTAQLRAKGVQTYGTGTTATGAKARSVARTATTNTSAVRSLMALIEYLWNVLMEVRVWKCR